MGEIIFTILSTIFLYLLTKIIPWTNKFATTLLDVLPLLPPVFMYTYNKPKIYLKTLSFRNLNITYMLNMQINNCKLDLNNFKDLENYLVNIKNYKGKKTNDYCYNGSLLFSKLVVATNVIDLTYDVNRNVLLINSESKMNYKHFIKYIDKVLESINLFFQEQPDIKYKKDDMVITLRIKFDDEYKNIDIKCKNPFWNKLFKEFDNKTASLLYYTKNKTKITLGNNNIDFTSSDLEQLEHDIQQELKFFLFKN